MLAAPQRCNSEEQDGKYTVFCDQACHAVQCRRCYCIALLWDGEAATVGGRGHRRAGLRSYHLELGFPLNQPHVVVLLEFLVPSGLPN